MKKINSYSSFYAIHFHASTHLVNNQATGLFSMQQDLDLEIWLNYISQPSFRGGLIEYRKAIKDNVLVGVDFGWNVFYEKKDADTYTSGTEALSGVQYRTQNAIPILVSAEYFLSTENALKPYVGLGIGTMYLERSTDMGNGE
jgi:opacity protein-like surface antigen